MAESSATKIFPVDCSGRALASFSVFSGLGIVSGHLSFLQFGQFDCQPTFEQITVLLGDKREANPRSAIAVGVYNFSCRMNHAGTRKGELSQNLAIDRQSLAALQG